MKTNLFVIAANSLVALVIAQDGLPACAQPCVTKYLKQDLGSCSQFDIACICSSKQFLGGISCCLESNCSAADQEKAAKYALNLCQANKVTDLPTAVTGLCTETSSQASSATGDPASISTTILTGTLLTTSSPSMATITSSAPSTLTSSASLPSNTKSSSGAQNFAWKSSSLLSFVGAALAMLG